MEATRKITRKRSRESGAERRSKDRERKRRKRAAPATAPVVDNSSSSDEGNPQETEAYHHPEAHLFESDAGAAAWLRSRQNEVTRAGNRGENASSNSSATAPSPESHPRAQGHVSGAEGQVEETPANNGFSDISVDIPQDDSGAGEDSDGRNRPDSRETSDHNRQSEEINRNPEGFRANPVPVQGDGTTQQEEQRDGHGAQTQGDAEEPPRNPWENHEQQYNAHERLAMALAGVRGSSNISDEAINKMLHVALYHRETLQELAEGRKTDKLYTKRLRPKAVKRIPQVFCALLLEEKVQGGLNYRRLSDLKTIPKEYQNLPNRGRIKVIREESYVKLADIKKHHNRIHRAKGATEEDIRNHYGNAQHSVDGVEEARKCKKTFHVVTLRLGECIYLYKIFNPLVGHQVANPSVQEVLG